MKKIVKSIKEYKNDNIHIHIQYRNDNVGADDPVRPQPNRNTQKGITLVALVITIIVLILLAAVSINIVQNSGLIEKTKLAKEEHRASAIQEQLDLLKNEQEIAKQNNETEPSINELINRLQEQNLITEEEKNTIMQTGKITIASKEITFSKDAILPQDYTRCEYLESTGTQYIDTELLYENGYRIDAKLTTSVDKDMTFAGVRSYENYNYKNHWISTSNIYRWQISYGQSWIAYPTVPVKDQIYEVSGYLNTRSQTMTVDGTTILSTTDTEDYSSYFNDYKIFLFARNGNINIAKNVANTFWYGRCYYTKIYLNDKLVLNLIPCLDSNNRTCMYDTVSGKTFYNQGTGEFIAGPELT